MKAVRGDGVGVAMAAMRDLGADDAEADVPQNGIYVWEVSCGVFRPAKVLPVACTRYGWDVQKLGSSPQSANAGSCRSKAVQAAAAQMPRLHGMALSSATTIGTFAAYLTLISLQPRARLRLGNIRKARMRLDGCNHDAAGMWVYATETSMSRIRHR
jgi:hypothetical protein